MTRPLIVHSRGPNWSVYCVGNVCPPRAPALKHRRIIRLSVELSRALPVSASQICPAMAAVPVNERAASRSMAELATVPVSVNKAAARCSPLTPPASPGGVWAEAVLYSFTGGSDGYEPLAGVAAGKGGALYGTTCCGGTVFGTVFKLKQ